MPVDLRLAEPHDAAAILSIYAPYCTASNVSFEIVAPSREQMADRIAQVSTNYPWLIAESAGQVTGYVYATRFRERAAYRWTTEVAVYVAPSSQRRGIGRSLYQALFSILGAQNYRKVIAGITVPNQASISLHESVGFRHVGTFPGVGHKGGEWLSVGWWQKDLLPELPDPPEPQSFAKLRDTRAVAAALATRRV
jgi:L-amino acid N-acyltransferase YncA